MSFLSASLEAVLLLATYSAFSVWTFTCIFNHDIIVNSHRRTPKAEFNHVSARLGLRLLHLDTDGEADGNSAESMESSRDSHDLSAFSCNPVGLSRSSLNSLHSTHFIVGIVFSLGIALSLELILLLMIQLFGSVEVGVSLIKIVIKLLVILASTINPLLVIFLALNQRFSLKTRGTADVSRYAITLAAFGLWYLALTRFGGIASELEADHGTRSLLERHTNEIALLGISITAILSGIGSTSTPLRTFWTDSGEMAAFLGRGSRRPRISEAEVNEGIQSYNSTKMILSKRRAELRSIAQSSPSRHSGTETRGLFHRVKSLASMGGGESLDLKQEIASLESLKEAIYVELCGKLDRLTLAKNESRNRLDALMTVFNLVFSVYCIYRLVNVIFLRLPYHYWNTGPSTSLSDDADNINNITKDAIAITIAKIIQTFFGYLPLSETQLINQVSFILSGSLFLCSFQNVLVTFTSVGNFLPAPRMAASTKGLIKNLILSELLAIYVIATALLMRSNLPSESAKSISQILSLTSGPSTFREIMREVQFIDAWFDKVFAISGVISFLVLVLKLHIDNDAIETYDEEAMLEDKLS